MTESGVPGRASPLKREHAAYKEPGISGKEECHCMGRVIERYQHEQAGGLIRITHKGLNKKDES